MYTLRTVHKEGKSHNQFLGDNYATLYKDTCDEYEKTAAICTTNENTYAIIVASDGSKLIPLYKGNQDYYIMTERGKTFEKL
jgi:hypothetical protein